MVSKKWFYDTKDTVDKSPQELFRLYKIATAQDNILILDLPPDRSGRLRERDRQTVFALKRLIEQAAL